MPIKELGTNDHVPKNQHYSDIGILVANAKYSDLKPTRKDYYQFIMATLLNYTQTDMADHHLGFSHDAINQYSIRAIASSNGLNSE